MPSTMVDVEKCPRETLLRLLEAYSRLYIALDGFWYLAVKAEFGNEKALEHDVWVWEKMCRREVDSITEALGVEERDLAAFFQVFTMTPWFRKMEYKTELRADGSGILTILHCPTLLALEREGEGRERSICQTVDVDYFTKFAGHFSENLEITPRVIPPRKDKDGICCQWEVRLKRRV